MKIYKYFILAFLLSLGSCIHRELFFTPNETTYVKGDIFYNYKDGKSTKAKFQINDSNEISNFVRILNKSERISLISLNRKIFTLHLDIAQENGDCQSIDIIMTENNGTVIYEYSACSGIKVVQGRFSNDKLGEFIIKYVEENDNVNLIPSGSEL